jgi:hypothetical protein
MDGASVGAESLWPNVIRWKPVFSSNWKNIKNRQGEGGGPTVVWKEKFKKKIKNINQTLLK